MVASQTPHLPYSAASAALAVYSDPYTAVHHTCLAAGVDSDELPARPAPQGKPYQHHHQRLVAVLAAAAAARLLAVYLAAYQAAAAVALAAAAAAAALAAYQAAAGFQPAAAAAVAAGHQAAAAAAAGRQAAAACQAPAVAAGDKARRLIVRLGLGTSLWLPCGTTGRQDEGSFG